MALLSLDGVHKSHDELELLRGVSLAVEEDTRVGVVGANGCGKSTLMRILAGVEKPDAGRRWVRPGLRIGHLLQDVVVPQGTVRDAVRGGLTGRADVLRRIDDVHHELAAPDLAPEKSAALLAELSRLEARRDLLGGHDVEHRVEAMIEHVGLADPDAPTSGLSGGEQRRVALASVLLDEPDLLLLDEPTNHLDAFVVDWLEDRLLETRVPVVMVTHDRYFLDRVVDRVIEIERGALHAFDGGYAGYLRGKAARDLAEQRAETARQSLLRRETAWMRRGPPARTTKAQARIERYHKLLDDAPEEAGGVLEFRIPPGPRLGTLVMRLRGATLRVGGRTLVAGLDLDVGRGERLGIVGANGVGKTTLLRTLTGARAPDVGTAEVGETVRVAAIDQLRTALDPEKTVVEEIAHSVEYVRVGADRMRIESFLDQFLFPGERKRVQIKRLSGGERNRVLLAKLLLDGGNVLVLDEPTNDLDLPTLRALEEALVAFEGAVIVVSHDRWFLDRVATEIVHLDGRGGFTKWGGDVTSLLERVAEKRADEERAAAARSARPASPPPAPVVKPKKLGARDARELEELPAKIDAAEKRVADATARLSEPSLYAGPAADRARVEAELRDATDEAARLFARWEELESKKTEAERGRASSA
jgi:ATP-binding cassette subfamily F protein uup